MGTHGNRYALKPGSQAKRVEITEGQKRKNRGGINYGRKENQEKEIDIVP